MADEYEYETLDEAEKAQIVQEQLERLEREHYGNDLRLQRLLAAKEAMPEAERARGEMEISSIERAKAYIEAAITVVKEERDAR